MNNINKSEVLKDIISSLDIRIVFEKETFGAEKTIKQLGSLKQKAEQIDSRALVYMGFNNVDFNGFVNSTKLHGTRANIYSIPKFWEICRALAGVSFDDMLSSDHATIVCTIVAMAEGNSNQKRIENRLNDLMTGIRRFQMFYSSKYASYLAAYQAGKKPYEYCSGNVQGGSSLRALEALGIVQEAGREGNCKLWKFTDTEKTKAVIQKAFSALCGNMFESENDSNYVLKTEILPSGARKAKEESTVAKKEAKPVKPVKKAVKAKEEGSAKVTVKKAKIKTDDKQGNLF